MISFAFAYSIECASIESKSSESSSSEERAFDDAFKEECVKKTGNEIAYQNYRKAKNELKPCLIEATDLDSLKTDFQNIMDDSNSTDVKSLFHKHCPKRDAIFKCVDDFASVMKVCYDEDESRISDLFENVTKAVLDFACDHDGDNLIKFVENDGIDCAMEHRDEFQECVTQVQTKYPNWENEENVTRLVEMWCDATNIFGTCVTEKFKRCTNKVPSDVIGGFFELIHARSDCEHLTKVSTNAAENNRL